MLKDITLGQYFPGNSVAHKLDPRTKILLVTLYIIALFSAKGLVGYAVMIATLAGSEATGGHYCVHRCAECFLYAGYPLPLGMGNPADLRKGR